MPGAHIPFSRYVALGDSQTEGVGDGDDLTGLRGWADRLAEYPVRHSPDLLCANLAVRGRLAGGPRRTTRRRALALRPDLATVVAGVNDLLRPRFDADEVAGHLESDVHRAHRAGDPRRHAHLPRRRPHHPARPACPPPRHCPQPPHPRGRASARRRRRRDQPPRRRHRAPVEHGPPARQPARPPAHRRGHRPRSRPARQRRLLDPPPARPRHPAGRRRRTGAAERRWAAEFLGPWITRRLRGRSSGDGRTAKRPHLTSPDAAPPTRRDLDRA